MTSVFSRLSKIFSLSGEATGPNAWEIGAELGRGTTGIVYQVQNKVTHLKAAMKVVDSRHQMTPDEWNLLKERTYREANILKLLDHPSIVKIYDFYEKDGKWYLVMELVTGGELLDRVQDHPDGRIPEKQARIWFRQIVSAVQYCHEHLIVHRDLKLENVLIDKDDNVKITDFGFANFIADHEAFMKTFCGSPMYAPPEIFIGVKYKGPPLDIWSMGVLLFTMLAGAFPWKSKQADYNLMREVVSGRFALPAHMSPAVQNLIKSMLVVNPDDRPSPTTILNDPWLRDDDLPPLKSATLMSPSSIELLNGEILSQLEELGFDRETAISELMKGNTNLVKAAYDLLAHKQEKDVDAPVAPSAGTANQPSTSGAPLIPSDDHLPSPTPSSAKSAKHHKSRSHRSSTSSKSGKSGSKRKE